MHLVRESEESLYIGIKLKRPGKARPFDKMDADSII